jgi:hypothetical protein
MMRASIALKSIVLSGLLLVASLATGLAREEIPAETREGAYRGALAQCADPGVLGAVMGSFNATEQAFWGGTAAIAMIEHPHEVGFRPHGLDLLPRRYCTGEAIFADRSRRTVNYAIVERMGLSGIGDGVHFCVDGFDRNHTAMGECRRFDR